MAAYPTMPTGYNSDLDVKFQLKDAKINTFEEIAGRLKNEHGENADLFY